MTQRAVGELIQPKDSVALTVAFRDPTGVLIDADSVPQITIIAPDGLVALGPTSAGVSKISTGKYQFDFTVGFTGPYGVWSYNWLGYANSFRMEASFNFVVNTTDQPALNTDGYYALGDDPGFQYDQISIFNINKLLKTLRSRLNSRGKTKSTDAFGNVIYVDCDIFSVDNLVTFLASSLTLFNEIPHFTFFQFHETQFVNMFHDVLVEGAVVQALASQALIERGAEGTISDQGLGWNPPTISELLNTQFSTLLTLHMDKIKFIKNSMKPHPIGLGTFSINNGYNPAIRRLRHLKEKQIL